MNSEKEINEMLEQQIEVLKDTPTSTEDDPNGRTASYFQGFIDSLKWVLGVDQDNV